MSKNVIVGAITNYETKDIEPWVESVIRNVPNAEVYMICKDIGQKTQNYLSEKGVNVTSVPSKIPGGNICVERFNFYKILVKLQLNPEDIVLATDVKDVVFQDDPFPRIRNAFNQSGTSILLTSEGITYENELWGKQNMALSFGNAVLNEMLPIIIHNAGVFGGIAKEFSILSDMIYRYSLSTGKMYVEGGGGPDQAALNVLVNNPFIQPYCVSSSTIACQCGTVNNPAYTDKITQLGGALKDDGYVYHPNGTKFPVVHQYDRIPEWNKVIKEKYSS